jgi:hypothetical protein
MLIAFRVAQDDRFVANADVSFAGTRDFRDGRAPAKACALLLPRDQQARGLRLRPLAGRNISRMDFAGPVDALSGVKRARSVETRLYSAENK